MLMGKRKEMEFNIKEMEADMRALGKITNLMGWESLFMPTRNLILENSKYLLLESCYRMAFFMDSEEPNFIMVISIEDIFIREDCKV